MVSAVPELVAMRGLPGSGKSTYAREWVAQDPERRYRLNNDDLRGMGHDGVYIPQRDGRVGTEPAIKALLDAGVAELLARGWDVVVDNTNLTSREIRHLRRRAALAGATFRVVDLTNVPVAQCRLRNAARTGRDRVPDDKVLAMWRRHVERQPYPLPIADDPTDVGELEPYDIDLVAPGAPEVVLVDIDGTVALHGGRSPFDESLVHEDRPNPAVIRVVRALHMSGVWTVFMSGRTEVYREATRAWLEQHVGVTPLGIHMRAQGDSRRDSVVKAELFDKEIRHRYRVVAVVDDRQQVVDMWRALGLTVMQVAPGNF